jgi:hypothetical protein
VAASISRDPRRRILATLGAAGKNQPPPTTHVQVAGTSRAIDRVAKTTVCATAAAGHLPLNANAPEQMAGRIRAEGGIARVARVVGGDDFDPSARRAG